MKTLYNVWKCYTIWQRSVRSRTQEGLHLTEEGLSWNIKNNDKKMTDLRYIVTCFDLQPVLPCPEWKTSSFYFTSKLIVLNLLFMNLLSRNRMDDVSVLFQMKSKETDEAMKLWLLFSNSLSKNVVLILTKSLK